MEGTNTSRSLSNRAIHVMAKKAECTEQLLEVDQPSTTSRKSYKESPSSFYVRKSISPYLEQHPLKCSLDSDSLFNFYYHSIPPNNFKGGGKKEEKITLSKRILLLLNNHIKIEITFFQILITLMIKDWVFYKLHNHPCFKLYVG